MENEKLTLAPEKAEALKKHCLDILNEKHFINANAFFEVMEQVGIEQKVKSFAETVQNLQKNICLQKLFS